jgi:DNA-binding FadR family transcriptional regulator
MRLDVYLHTADPRLDTLIGMVNQLLQQEKIIMAGLDDITAAVAAETTVLESAETLLASLHDQLVAALASSDPAAIQAVVDQIGTNTAALAAAVAANTPAAPPAAPAP